MTTKPTANLECPNCKNRDPKLMSRLPLQTPRYECVICSAEFIPAKQP